MSDIVGSEGSSIVTTDLIDTCSERSRAVEITDDDVWVGRESTLEVWTHWGYEDEEAILLRRMHTHLRTCTDEQRTDIERSTTLVGRNPLLVEADHLLHHLLEQLCWHLWHQDTTACALQAGSVLVHTEHAHLAVWATISLQTLECFLTIVQTGCSHVQFQILIRANFYFAPFAVAIVTANIVVSLAIAK